MNKPVQSQPGRPITVERGGIIVTRVGVHLGAEIGGVDLRKPLSDAAFETIRDALVDNELIIFRNQEISSDNLIDFGQRFGESHDGLGRGSDARRGCSEKERENHDLQHFAASHCVERLPGEGGIGVVRHAGPPRVVSALGLDRRCHARRPQ